MWTPIALTVSAFSISVYAQAAFPDCTSGVLASNSICDTSLDSYTRATGLVSLFTLAEKISNSQNESPGVSRIKLPAYEWWNEALHGVADSPGVTFAAAGQNYSYATSFPQPITLGAAFDDDLIFEIATVTSTEARVFNNGGRAGLDYWTPNINPFRDPRWGRGAETPGEDPYHISRYVSRLIPGLQGPSTDKYQKITATCKHYAGYDLENYKGTTRYGFNAIIKPQELRDYYLPPFQTCARDSDVQSIMCAYNSVNGVPACADPYFLQTVLREHWGWNEPEQYVVSDCDAVQNIYNPHAYTKTTYEAVAVALNAGTDLNCGQAYKNYLQGAYDRGLINTTVLDRSLIRRYASLVKLGYFDSPSAQPYRRLTFADVSTPSAEALALRAAEEGIVLLKNDGLLPFKSTVKKLAVIGPLANSTTQMLGGYSGIPKFAHSPLYAAQRAGFNVTYVKGTNINSDLGQSSQVLAAARAADAVIFVGGVDLSIEDESNDRETITWPSSQLSLINQLAGAGKPLVVVHMGTGLDSSSIKSNSKVNSIVWAGYPGQDGGTAIFNILTGKTSPSGRLPITFYPGEYVNQVPMTNMSLTPYSSSSIQTNNPGRTYKFYTGTPVYPFGHGLHYTNFTTSLTPPSQTTYTISSLLSSSTAKYPDLTPFLSLPLTVSNTGNVSSSYIALLFLSGSFGLKPYPKKSLVGYQRVSNLGGGKSTSVTFAIKIGDLARADEAGNMVLWPGDYKVGVDIDGGVSWSFTLTGEKRVLDTWPAAP